MEHPTTNEPLPGRAMDRVMSFLGEPAPAAPVPTPAASARTVGAPLPSLSPNQPMPGRANDTIMAFAGGEPPSAPPPYPVRANPVVSTAAKDSYSLPGRAIEAISAFLSGPVAPSVAAFPVQPAPAEAVPTPPPPLPPPEETPFFTPPEAFALSGAAASGCPAIVVRDGFAGPSLAADAYAAALSLQQDNRLRPAGMGRGDSIWHDSRARGDLILWVSAGADRGGLLPPALETVLEAMRSIGSELQRHYPAAGLSLSGRTSTQLAFYPGDGTGYVQHLDTSRRNGGGGGGGGGGIGGSASVADAGADQRRLTVLYYLNPRWTKKDGGWLRAFLPESVAVTEKGTGAVPAAPATCAFSPRADGQPIWDVAPLQDRLVAFRSDLVEHAVLPAHAPRFALTMWFYASESGCGCGARPRQEPPLPFRSLNLPAGAATTADAGAAAPVSVVAAAGQNREMDANDGDFKDTGGFGNTDGGGGGGSNGVGDSSDGSGASPADTRAKVRPLPLPKDPASRAALDSAAATIFVSVVAYRDPEWAPTVADLFARASAPGRISVGLVLQGDEGEAVLVPPEVRGSVRTLRLAAAEAAGPCWARHLAQQLWRGERYVLQIDSHMRFRPGWDSYLIDQLSRCIPAAAGPSEPAAASSTAAPSEGAAAAAAGAGAERAVAAAPLKPTSEQAAVASAVPSSQPRPRAVLTAYPPPYELPHRIPITETRTTLLVPAGFGADDGLLRQRGRLLRAARQVPVPSPLWASGFSFAEASVFADCPYDPALRHVFFGEEVSMAARLFTSGYDFFAPGQTPLYHLWTRTHRPSFREHVGAETRAEQAAARARLSLLLQLGDSGDDSDAAATAGSAGSTDTEGAAVVAAAAATAAAAGGAVAAAAAAVAVGVATAVADTIAAGSAALASLPLGRYGLGTARSLAEFERRVGVDLRRRVLADGADNGGLRPGEFNDSLPSSALSVMRAAGLQI